MGEANAAETGLHVQCCIAGGGPAGIMLGYLLARAGLEVAVLEKHADFLRDFRGDTIHPSTLQVMHELGLLDGLLALPHTKAETISAEIGGRSYTVADFRALPVRCPYIALLPQWHFLNYLAEQGQRFPGFRLMMRTEAQDLVVEGGQVVGLRAAGPDGPLTIRADLVVGADGRRSSIRKASGSTPDDIGAPMDVLWFALSRKPGDGSSIVGRVGIGHFVITIDRGDYWQCAFIIAKGGYEKQRSLGLPAFQKTIAAVLPPVFTDRVAELDDWDKVKLLTVGVDRLESWHRPGLLVIGDAAHTMSPIGGVGINLALQDAIATANRIATPLLRGTLSEADLAAVQRRRILPARLTQAIQIGIANRVVVPLLASDEPFAAPWPLRLVSRTPSLQRLFGRIAGLGFLPEHVRSPTA